jgi:hypothetical protein
MFLDIIRRPVFILKHVSETGFCLRLQVEPTQLGPIDTASRYLRNRIYLKTETESILRNAVFK